MKHICKMKLVIVISLVVHLVIGKSLDFRFKDVVCKAYDACHPTDDLKINVHLVPHSHDDVGWLKTVNGYFNDNVESIIGSTVAGLARDSKRRFVQVETAFFKMWLEKQPDETIEIVKNLLQEGRLEILGGGWSMNDEAAAYYQSTIDQFTLGLKYLLDTLGKCARPKVGWQIDPFGHSREQASIFSQMAFDAFIMGRIDYRDKSRRENDKAMDLLWRSSDNLENSSVIFSSVLNHHYSTPSGFCWDKGCRDPIIVTDEASDLYNWEERVNTFVERIQDYISHYPTNNILIPFGDDFQWQSAEKYFINVDRLIAGFKKFNPTINGKELNVIYSTPSCYAKSVNSFVESNTMKLEVKTDDFFPYADGPNTVWSGFFTSRPSSKRYERIGNAFNQMVKQLSGHAGFSRQQNVLLEEAMGVMQHHDAITGTEKQAVEKDYHKHLYSGIEQSIEIITEALRNLIGIDGDNLHLKYCPLANTSICAETEGKTQTNILLYNSLARQVSKYIQIPVSGTDWRIKDPEGKILNSYITVPARDYSYITEDIGGNIHQNILIFKAENLPAMGFNVYELYKDMKIHKPQPSFVPLHLEEDTKIGFDETYVILNHDNGLVSHIQLNGIEIEVKIELLYYKSPESGAYIFRSDTQDRVALRLSEKPDNYILDSEGDVIELKQEFRDWATFIIRIYKDANFIEVDWQVGPIDVGDGDSKDIILRYSSTMASENIFYTDSNGREMLERKMNYRPDYEYTNEEPQAGNYYPVNSRINIKDKNNQFGVIVDRSEGGASLRDGWIELMLHRGLLYDDNRGVGEHLYEIEYGIGLVVKGSHYLTIAPASGNDNRTAGNVNEKILSQEVNLAPIPFYFQEEITTKSKSFLTRELPYNINFLTLMPWNENDDTLLIRLEHSFEKEDDPNLSTDTIIDLEGIFDKFNIKSLVETTLDGTLPLTEVSQLKWFQISTKEDSRLQRKDDDLKISLAPMQIRTFIATIERTT